MKRCPDCRRDYYDDSLMYCLDDGAALLEGPSSGNEQATAFLRSDSFEESPTRTIGEGESSFSNLTSPDVAARPHTSNKIWIFSVIGALILGAAGFALYKSWSKSAPHTAGPLQIERLTTNGQATSAAISPDGKYVIYGVDEGGKDSLWLRQVATNSNVQIFPAAEDVFYWGLTFSPDSTFINFIRAEFEKNIGWGLEQMPVLGGPQKRLVDAEGGISYSPDGAQFAFIRDEFPSDNESSLMIANADGSGERIVASRRRPEIFRARRAAPAWSPDGKSIAAIISDESTVVQSPQVNEFDVAGGGPGRPVKSQEWNDIRGIAWTMDKGGLIVLGADKASSSFMRQIWYFGYPGGEVRRITTDLNNYNSLSLDAGAKTLVTVQSNEVSNFWSVPNGDSSKAVQVRSGGNNEEGMDGLALAPDGRILFRSRVSGREDLWIMGPDGGSPKQLTAESGANLLPFVSPDGRFIVYTSERDGKINVWRMGIDGSGATQLTQGNGDYYPSVSPDSRWVIYTSEAGGNSYLHKISIDGGEAERLTEGFANRAMISPDGKWIVSSYRKDANSTWRHAIIPFEGGEPTKVFDLVGHKGIFRWSPDSRSLYYIRDTKGGVTNVWNFNPEKGESKQVTDFKSETIFDFVWSSDGKQLVLSRGTSTSDVVLIRNF
ncbi:MAG: DPP IV N-terminal domain-containing protein [bacterium]|nr:DPP IV N-terminal domain-containing protein [bacterium]